MEIKIEIFHPVENLAYQKESFVNNRRHSKRHVQNHWVHGQAAKAVDGEIGQSCIMLDNSFVEKPIWMVDLGKKTTISGVVIVTWNGVARGKLCRREFILRARIWTHWLGDLI